MPASTFAKSRPHIEKALLATPAISRARLVALLVSKGIPTQTAYRHISKYMRGIWGKRHLPTQQEVFVRVTGALEQGLEQIVDGRKGNLGGIGRLLLEAHGILEPIVDESMSEKERLAAAALAILALRGAESEEEHTHGEDN